MDTAAWINGLYDSDQNAAYACLKHLLQESKHSNALYAYFDQFVELTKSDSSYMRARGLLLIAACARWDTDNKIDEVIDDCLAHIMDGKPTVSRQWIAALPELAQDKPELAEDIRRALRRANPGRYRDSMAPLIQQDIAKALAALSP